MDCLELLVVCLIFFPSVSVAQLQWKMLIWEDEIYLFAQYIVLRCNIIAIGFYIHADCTWLGEQI